MPVFTTHVALTSDVTNGTLLLGKSMGTLYVLWCQDFPSYDRPKVVSLGNISSKTLTSCRPITSVDTHCNGMIVGIAVLLTNAFYPSYFKD